MGLYFSAVERFLYMRIVTHKKQKEENSRTLRADENYCYTAIQQEPIRCDRLPERFLERTERGRIGFQNNKMQTKKHGKNLLN